MNWEDAVEKINRSSYKVQILIFNILKNKCIYKVKNDGINLVNTYNIDVTTQNYIIKILS